MTQIEVIRETPPPVWLRACTSYLPELEPVETNGDLAMVIAPLVSAILQCDQDKKALEEWANESPTPPLKEAQ